MFPLADSTLLPTPSGELIFLAYFVGASITFLGAAVAIVTIWDKLKRKPPAGEVFATKDELGKVAARIDLDLKDLDKRSDKRSSDNGDAILMLENRVETDLTSFERRITGEVTSNHVAFESRFGELGGKLDSMQSGLQSLSNDLFRAVGQLEGVTRHGAVSKN